MRERKPCLSPLFMTSKVRWFQGSEVWSGDSEGREDGFSSNTLIKTTYCIKLGASQVLQWFKKIHHQCRRCKFNPWIGKISWSRKWQPVPVILAWNISWTEEPGRPQSIGSQRGGHDCKTEYACNKLNAETDSRI